MKHATFYLFLSFFMVGECWCQHAEVPLRRTLTSAEGKTLDVTILSKDAETIRVRKEVDGKEVDIPLKSLSKEDREFVSGLSIAAEKSAPSGAKPAGPKDGKPEALKEIPFGNGEKLRFRKIAPGTFTMGSPKGEEGRSFLLERQVEVRITKSFWMATTEVTQGNWKTMMGDNPSKFKGDNLPVEMVSWENARNFVAKVNGSGVLPTGWKMDMPTEAQWEYACRAETKDPFGGLAVDETVWHMGNSGNKTQPVATKKANGWGLHDMHGNVSEWCKDWFERSLQGGADPAGPDKGEERVARGGNWFWDPQDCRAAARTSAAPDCKESAFGFRPILIEP